MFGLQIVLVLVICFNGVNLLRPSCYCNKYMKVMMSDRDWINYKMAANKVYPSCYEECRRRYIWEHSCNYTKYFKHHGKFLKTARGEPTFEVAPNKFSDMSESERRQMLSGLVVPNVLVSQAPSPSAGKMSRLGDSTPSINYVEKGYVTSVKDQGWSCNSCWAFVAVAAIEAQFRKMTGVLREFSPQWFLDCCNNPTQYACYGCDGGWMNGAFQCTIDMGGVWPMYKPYEQNVGVCFNRTRYRRFRISGYVAVPMGDETTMSEYLYKEGPLACAMDAYSSSLVYYSNGIFSDTTCTTSVNHAVTVVGQGVDNVTGMAYWLCKNSWGSNWGEKGFFRIIKGLNLCGIAQYCSYPKFQLSVY